MSRHDLQAKLNTQWRMRPLKVPRIYNRARFLSSFNTNTIYLHQDFNLEGFYKRESGVTVASVRKNKIWVKGGTKKKKVRMNDRKGEHLDCFIILCDLLLYSPPSSFSSHFLAFLSDRVFA